jgi:plasmid stabilization system protein ParE
MVDKIKLSTSAQKELEDSFDWYEEQSVGLGDRFSEVIYASLNSISNDPEAYNKKKANIRAFVVDKFPFIIIYEYLKKSDMVYVLHIFHTSRNPKLKYKKK